MKTRRKTLSFLLAISLALGSLAPALFCFGSPITVQAAEVTAPSGPLSGTCGDTISWQLEVDPSGTIYPGTDTPSPTCYKLTLAGTGDMERNLFLPQSNPWYGYREVITSVVINEGITSICSYGLANLCSLESIQLPDSIVSIGTDAFRGDDSLKTIVCGSGLKQIGYYAFMDLVSLTDIQFQEGLIEIGKGAFYGCLSLSSISLPESLTTIREEAFYNSGLTSITIPRNVTCIESGVLGYTVYLSSIRVAYGNSCFCIKDNLLYEMREDGTCFRAIAYTSASPSSSITFDPQTERIDNSTFAYVKNLTSLAFPDALTSIGDQAFYRCRNLASVSFPNSLKTIGFQAFAHCAISEVNIPDSTETLNINAFELCSNLTSVTIGKGLKTLSGAFKNSKAISTITISAENPYLESIENVVYNREHTCLLYYAPQKPDTEYHVTEQVTTVDIYAICSAANLKKLYLPELLDTLDESCIISNQNLNSIYFAGNAPTSLGNQCIMGNATNLILYRTDISTGWDTNSAYWDTYTWAEWNPGNISQESGTFGSLTWTYSGSDGRITFTGSGSIPDFTEESPAPWSGYMDSIQTIEAESVADIGDYSFCKASSLLRLETGAELNRIGNYAFKDCRNMKFPGITHVNSIGTAAFQNDAAISGSLTLEKVSSMNESAFQGCSAISYVTLGSHLTALTPNVFAGCTSLSTFMIPEKVAAIQDGALKGCTSLRSVNIPKNTDAIGSQAFSGDTALEKVYFYGAIPSNWASDSFENCSGTLNLCYRTAQAGWNGLNGNWNNIPLLGQERFYAEQQDHYSFSNNANSFGYSADYRLPKWRYVDTLGSISLATYYYVREKKWEGSCYGMTGSTLEFYENPEEFPVDSYCSSANSLYEIPAPHNKDAELTKLIETRQISQYHPDIAGCSGSISRHMGDYYGLVKKIEEFERAGGLRIDSNAEPIILLMYSCHYGHAVIPVSIDQTDDGNFMVKIYDPNHPANLRTLTINKDFSGISYGSYFMASYVPYSEFTASLSAVKAYSEEDKSLYLSIDKEHGTVTDASGKDISETEGAYEQKPMASKEDDTFSGIKSYVLPKGNYQLTTDVPEGKSESSNPDSVSFYLGTEECFAEITSSDENAILNITESDTIDGTLTMELQSESGNEENASFTLVNSQGMERAVEIGSSNATITIAENNDIAIQAPGQGSVLLDGQETLLQDGQAASSFVAAKQENPLKVSLLEKDVACDTENKLNGTLQAEVISNATSNKAVTVTAEFLENNKAAAVYTQNYTLTPGLNNIFLTFDKLKSAFQQTEGTLALSLKFTVADEAGNTAVFTNESISVTLTKQPDSGSSEPDKDNSDDKEPDKDDSDDKEPDKNGSSNSGNKKPGSSGSGSGQTNTGKPDSSQNSSGSGSPSATKKREVTSIKTDVKKLTLGLGETYSLKATALPENASDKKLRYTASNKTITVSPTGKITAKKTGSSRIIISSSNGKTASVQVTVKKRPAKITLNAKTKTIKASWKFQIKVKFPKGTASHKLTYSSSRRSVATVSSTGKITARKKGTAIITVKTYNGKKAKMKIIVTKQ